MIARYEGFIIKRTFPKDEGDSWTIKVCPNDSTSDKALKTFENVTDATREQNVQKAKDWIDQQNGNGRVAITLY